MNQRTRFLGLDVHKETIAVAIAEEGSEPQLHSTIANRPEAVRKMVREVGGSDVWLVAAYEAGPTGYAVHRQLVQLGVDSKVVAPSLIPRASGDRVKTARREAVRLARLLRSGDLVAVWVPDDEHEALRDLVAILPTGAGGSPQLTVRPSLHAISSTPERFRAAPESMARNAAFASSHRARPARPLTGFCFDAAEFNFVTACSFVSPRFAARISPDAGG